MKSVVFTVTFFEDGVVEVTAPDGDIFKGFEGDYQQPMERALNHVEYLNEAIERLFDAQEGDD